jgi:signal transduction histidine kinase
MDRLSTITAIVTAITAVPVTSILTIIFQRRKYNAEAHITEEQAHAQRAQLEQEMTEKLNRQFSELADKFKADAEEQRAQNKKLEQQVAELNIYINRLTNWVVTENASYRTYLEDEIRKMNPDFKFPKTKPAPKQIMINETDSAKD